MGLSVIIIKLLYLYSINIQFRRIESEVSKLQYNESDLRFDRMLTQQIERKLVDQVNQIYNTNTTNNDNEWQNFFDTNCGGNVKKMASLVSTFIQKLNWTTVVFIYDIYTANVIDELTELISDGYASLIRYQWDKNLSNGILQQFLSTTYDRLKTHTINFFIICQMNCVKDVISQADGFDLTMGNFRRTAMNMNSRWIIYSTISDDGQDLSSYIMNLDNVAILNFNLEDVERVIDIKTLLWINGHKRKFSNVGHVSKTGKITINQIVFPNVYFDFNGRNLIVTTLWWPPFTMQIKQENITHYFGFCIDLLDELANNLNFTYDLVEPPDQGWGLLLENGTWTGMIGQLQERQVDLMIAAASIQASREQVMDFSYPFYFDTSTFMMRRHDISKTKWRILLDPITWPVILCIIGCLPLIAGIIFSLEKSTPCHVSHAKDQITFLQIFNSVFRAMVYQGGECPRLSTTGKTVFTSWWMFTFLIVTMYTAHLAAERTVRINTKLRTFDELVSQDKYKWGTTGETYYVTLFQYAIDPTFQKIWQGIDKHRRYDPDILHQHAEIHVQKVLSEDYVYIESKAFMLNKAVNDCRILLADEEFSNMKYGVGLPNNSPFTDLFSQNILDLTESGVIKALWRRHWPKQNKCEGLKVVKAHTLTILDMQGAFYILSIGCFIGLIALILECIVSYKITQKSSLFGSLAKSGDKAILW